MPSSTSRIPAPASTTRRKRKSSSRSSRAGQSTSRASRAPGSAWQSPRSTWRLTMAISRSSPRRWEHISVWRFRSPARNGRRASVLAVAALAAAAFGCRGSDAVVEPPPAAAEAERPDELAELVRFGNHVREVDARQLAEHYRSLAFGDAFWSNDAAIRLSLLLSAPNRPYHDLDQA